MYTPQCIPVSPICVRDVVLLCRFSLIHASSGKVASHVTYTYYAIAFTNLLLMCYTTFYCSCSFSVNVTTGCKINTVCVYVKDCPLYISTVLNFLLYGVTPCIIKLSRKGDSLC